MSTSVLNVSTSDTFSSTNTKSLKSIDVDDVKKEDVQYESTNKSVQVQVIKDEVHDGKEVEVETESQTISTSDKTTADAELTSFDFQEQEVEDAESELFNAEMALALDHVRKLALFQKEALVNSICDTFASFNGREASINDISAIFGRIKSELALEAEEDEADEEVEDNEDEVDSDYHPNDDRYDYELDQDINEAAYGSSDADDSDYDPTDAEDVKQVEADLEEDGFDDLSADEVEENLETISYDEETIINSTEFDAEYFAAIECAVNAAKLEKERIYAKICKKYQSEFGDEVIEKAFEQFVDFEFEEEADAEKEENEEEEEDEADYDESEDEVAVDSVEFQNEMDFALDSVRKLAAKHKEAFVDEVCGAFVSLNGYEPSLSELSSVFGAIKSEFAEEATQEFLEDIEEEEEESEEEQNEIVNVD